MKKITAYKVKNINQVNVIQYKEGDIFLTDRTIGILKNGEIEPLATKDDLKKLEQKIKKLGEQNE